MVSELPRYLRLGPLEVDTLLRTLTMPGHPPHAIACTSDVVWPMLVELVAAGGDWVAHDDLIQRLYGMAGLDERQALAQARLRLRQRLEPLGVVLEVREGLASRLAVPAGSLFDDRWITLAEAAARAARCPRAACGAVIERGGVLLGVGTNGPPGSRCPDTPEHLALDHCPDALHAEDAALLAALAALDARYGRTDYWEWLQDATAWVYGHRGPCPRCRSMLRHHGITDIRYRPGPRYGTALTNYADDKMLDQEAARV